VSGGGVEADLGVCAIEMSLSSVSLIQPNQKCIHYPGIDFNPLNIEILCSKFSSDPQVKGFVIAPAGSINVFVDVMDESDGEYEAPIIEIDGVKVTSDATSNIVEYLLDVEVEDGKLGFGCTQNNVGGVGVVIKVSCDVDDVAKAMESFVRKAPQCEAAIKSNRAKERQCLNRTWKKVAGESRCHHHVDTLRFAKFQLGNLDK
jgi:hypothetical protein